MELINFVNMGTDDRILKSLPVEDCPEELVKAMNKQGLVQKEVTVQGANGKTFTRKQWVKASDAQTGGQQGNPGLPKVGDTVKTDKGELKILKVDGSDYTVKNASGIVSHISEQFIKDHSGGQSNSAHSSTPGSKVTATPNPSQPQSNGISFDMPAHGDAKKAVADLLASGKSRDDIMSAAKAAGITWTANDNAGINWMRASMAIQKHMKSGTPKQVTSAASVQNPVQQSTPTVTPQTSTKKPITRAQRPVHKLGTRGATGKQSYSYGDVMNGGIEFFHVKKKGRDLNYRAFSTASSPLARGKDEEWYEVDGKKFATKLEVFQYIEDHPDLEPIMKPAAPAAPQSTNKKPKVFTEDGGVQNVTRGGVGGQYMIHRKAASKYIMLQATKKDGSWGKPSRTELYGNETPEDALKRIQNNNPGRQWRFDPDSMED